MADVQHQPPLPAFSPIYQEPFLSHEIFRPDFIGSLDLFKAENPEMLYILMYYTRQLCFVS